jgi:hypothetical protein
MNLPWGYLTTLILTELWTLAALVPPARPRPLALLCFRLGLTMNELPFVAFAWLTASTVLALVQGDLTSPVTIGVAVVTFASVGLVAWRGSRALPAVYRAMGPISRRLPYGRILFRPFFRRRGAVERIPDLPYGPAGTRNLLEHGLDYGADGRPSRSSSSSCPAGSTLSTSSTPCASRPSSTPSRPSPHPSHHR